MMHFLEEDLFLAQGRGELRLGLAALREFLLGLAVELGVLNCDGSMCGEPYEELLVSLTMGSVDDNREHPVYSTGVTDRCSSDP